MEVLKYFPRRPKSIPLKPLFSLRKGFNFLALLQGANEQNQPFSSEVLDPMKHPHQFEAFPKNISQLISIGIITHSEKEFKRKKNDTYWNKFINFINFLL